jgi:exodeoxyribonuclease VII large subunit
MHQRSNSSATSVSELTQAIATLLGDRIGYVRVSGELSGFKAAASGHRYFTLKDEAAQIDCVMWSSRAIAFRAVDGMKVIIEGRLTVYPSRGKYQIDCQTMMPSGQGDLYLAFEALKRDLSDRGFFDTARKRSLPQLPIRIGVVTSATGAVLQDILSTLKRRSPFCQVYLCAATVQGDNAPAEVASALRSLNQTDCDAIIVARGGGSLEDLWAFNTLPVVQAIYNSAVPIVSAIGHETDFTLADFVADVRAATPTAAAELVTQIDQAELLRQTDNQAQNLRASINAILQRYTQRIESLSASYAFERVLNNLHNYAQKVDEAEMRSQKAISHHLSLARMKLDAIASHTESLHPLAPLRRGFALLQHQGELINNSTSLAEFDEIDIIRQTEIAHVNIAEVRKVEKT